MNYYRAKFAREAKDKPSDWVIIPVGFGKYRLEKIVWK